MSGYVLSDELGAAVCKAMGIDVTNVQRVIIDLRPCKPIHVTIEMIGTDALSGVDYSDLANAEVVTIGAE